LVQFLWKKSDPKTRENFVSWFLKFTFPPNIQLFEEKKTFQKDILCLQIVELKWEIFDTFGNKRFGDFLVKRIFYSKTKWTKIDVKMLVTVLELNFVWKHGHFFSKKWKKSWFFGKKIDKIDFFIIIQTKNYNIQIENWKISKSKSQVNGRKKWSFLGIFAKNDGSEYMICEFSEHKKSIYPYNFAKKPTFCENTIYPYVFENNPFFSIFFQKK